MLDRRVPLTTAETLRVRDAEMYRKRVERYTVVEIGRMFGLTHQAVSQRIALVPPALKARVREDVKRLHRLRIADFREEMAPHA